MKDLDIYIPGVTKVLEFIKITIVFKSGSKIDIIDELKKTEIVNRLFHVVVKGRFNYTVINKFNIGVFNVTIHTPEEIDNNARRSSEDFV